MSTIAQLNERIDQLENQLLLKDIETIKQAEKKLNSDLGNFSKVICVSIRYKIVGIIYSIHPQVATKSLLNAYSKRPFYTFSRR